MIVFEREDSRVIVICDYLNYLSRFKLFFPPHEFRAVSFTVLQFSFIIFLSNYSSRSNFLNFLYK